jgi:hypothetical protein
MRVAALKSSGGRDVVAAARDVMEDKASSAKGRTEISMESRMQAARIRACSVDVIMVVSSGCMVSAGKGGCLYLYLLPFKLCKPW